MYPKKPDYKQRTEWVRQKAITQIREWICWKQGHHAVEGKEGFTRHYEEYEEINNMEYWNDYHIAMWYIDHIKFGKHIPLAGNKTEKWKDYIKDVRLRASASKSLNHIDLFIYDLITDNYLNQQMNVFIKDYLWSKYGDKRGWTWTRLLENLFALIERFKEMNQRGDYVSPKQLQLIGRMMQCERLNGKEKNC